VFNTALLLFCGFHPRGGVLWLIFDGTRFTTLHAILFAAYANLAMWFAAEKFELAAVPEWTRRLLLSCGFGFVTWVGIMGVVESNHFFGEQSSSTVATLGAFAAMGLVSWLALRKRRDIYPLAVAMGSFIIVILCSIPRITNDDDALFFTLALWLIVSSTIAGKVLMTLMRRWRTEAAA
jgi:LPXTG-motif cell wall-anchored protein